MRPRHPRSRPRSCTARAWSAHPRRSRRCRHATAPSARSSASCSAGLMRMGPQNTLEPDLASSYKLSDDGKTWTFHIREDAVVAGRRARHLRRRPVHGRGAQGPRRVGRPLRLVGRGRDRGARRQDRDVPPHDAGRRLPRGDHPAAASGAPPGRDPVRRHRHQRVRHGARRQRPVRPGRAGRDEGRPRPGAAAPAADRDAGAARSPPRPTPSPRRCRRPRRPAAPRSSSGSSCSFFDGRRGRRSRGGERRHRRRGRPRARGGGDGQRAAGRRAHPLPDDDAVHGAAQPAPEPSGAARRAGAHGRCSPRSTARPRARRARRGRLGGRCAGAADVVGVRRGGRARHRVRPERGGRSRSRTPAGPRSTAPGRPRGPRRPTSSSCSAFPPRRTRGSRPWRRPCGTPGPTSGSR